jgi:hypothetical protein
MEQLALRIVFETIHILLKDRFSAPYFYGAFYKFTIFQMIIQKKRIRSLERYIPESFKDKNLFISISWIDNEKSANKV